MQSRYHNSARDISRPAVLILGAKKTMLWYCMLYSVHHYAYVQGLTQWGRVTHICVSNLTIIGLDNGLSSSWSEAIIWINVGILFIGPLGTKLQWNFIQNPHFFIRENPFQNVIWEMSPILSQPQCVNPIDPRWCTIMPGLSNQFGSKCVIVAKCNMLAPQAKYV